MIFEKVIKHFQFLCFDFLKNCKSEYFFPNFIFTLTDFLKNTINCIFVDKIIKEFFRSFLRKEMITLMKKLCKKLVAIKYEKIDIGLKFLKNQKKKKQFWNLNKKLSVKNLKRMFNFKNYSIIQIKQINLIKLFFIFKKFSKIHFKKNIKKEVIIHYKGFCNRIISLKLFYLS